MDAQANLSVRWEHVSEGTIPYVAAQLFRIVFDMNCAVSIR